MSLEKKFGHLYHFSLRKVHETGPGTTRYIMLKDAQWLVKNNYIDVEQKKDRLMEARLSLSPAKLCYK
jgi:hypothetical protein